MPTRTSSGSSLSRCLSLSEARTLLLKGLLQTKSGALSDPQKLLYNRNQLSFFLQLVIHLSYRLVYLDKARQRHRARVYYSVALCRVYCFFHFFFLLLAV